MGEEEGGKLYGGGPSSLFTMGGVIVRQQRAFFALVFAGKSGTAVDGGGRWKGRRGGGRGSPWSCLPGLVELPLAGLVGSGC